MGTYLGKGATEVEWTSDFSGVTRPASWLRMEKPVERKDGTYIQVLTAVTYSRLAIGDVVKEGPGERFVVIAAGYEKRGGLDQGLTTATLGRLS